MQSNEKKKNVNNRSFSNSKVNKNDEFYTMYKDIKKELDIYGKMGLFRGKKIILPCDLNSNSASTEIEKAKSNFHKYLKDNKKKFGIESISTSYWDATLSEEDNLKRKNKKFQDVDYSKYDIVITNPPFSLFREFVDVMEENKMQYIILGNIGSICYKNIFPLFKENKMWTGHSGAGHEYETLSDDGENTLERTKLGMTCWFTNIDHGLRSKQHIILKNTYYGNEDKYDKYDHQKYINVNRVSAIPSDYFEIMGVPLTFIVQFNPEQFEIIGISEKYDGGQVFINGKKQYGRLFIKRKKHNTLKDGHEFINDELSTIIGKKVKKVSDDFNNNKIETMLELYKKISQVIESNVEELKLVGWGNEADLFDLKNEICSSIVKEYNDKQK